MHSNIIYYFYTFLKVSTANATVWVVEHDMILNECYEWPAWHSSTWADSEGGHSWQMIQTATGYPLQVGAKVRCEQTQAGMGNDS